MKKLLLALALLLPSAAYGQNPVHVMAGTQYQFDHDEVGAADTAKYQLCVDVVDDTACKDVAVLKGAPVQGVIPVTFTLPAWVPRGPHSLSVRAVGFLETGASGPSNTLTNQHVVGKPGSPANLRTP